MGAFQCDSREAADTKQSLQPARSKRKQLCQARGCEAEQEKREQTKQKESAFWFVAHGCKDRQEYER